MNRHHVTSRCVILIAGATVMLLAGCRLLVQTGSPAASTGSISGIVLAADNADSSGITVTAEPTEGIRSATVLRMLSRQAQVSRSVAAQAITDARGAYALANLSPGTYTLYASSADALERSVTTSATVTAGCTVDAALMTLTRTGLVSGTVGLSDAASPLGVVVFVAGTSYAAMAAADGSYTLSYVPAGTGYTLVASKDGYGSAITSVSVRVAKTTTVEPICLVRQDVSAAAGSLSGIAQVDDTAALGVVVYVAGTSCSAMSDQNGAFTIDGVRPGPNYLLVADFIGCDSVLLGNLVVKAGEDTAVGTLKLVRHVTPVAAGSVSGSVVLSGAPTNAGAFVYLEGTSHICVTNDAGAFTLMDVAPGELTVTASKGGYASASLAVSVEAEAEADAGTLVLCRVPYTDPLAPFVLTITATAGGTVTPSSPQTVDEGVATGIAASADEGFGFARWTVTNGSATLGDARKASTTVALSNGDAVIRANFARASTLLVVSCSTPGSDLRPQWSWTRPDGTVKFRYQLDSEAGTWIETVDASTTTFSPASPLSLGRHVLNVQAQDSLGTWSESSSREVFLVKYFTSDADFSGCFRLRVDAGSDRLQLSASCPPYPFVWAACRTSGTVYKIDADTGAVRAGYLTGPGDSASTKPTAVSVDQFGNCWIANSVQSSITCIGSVQNRTCVDRNRNGRIDTSPGPWSVLPWQVNNSPLDECLLRYVSIAGSSTVEAYIAVDARNGLWWGPYGGSLLWHYEDGTGNLTAWDVFPSGDALGLGLVVDHNQNLWSGYQRLYRITVPLQLQGFTRWAVGDVRSLAIDPGGDLWYFENAANHLVKRDTTPSSTVLLDVPVSNDVGDCIVVTPDGSVWVAFGADNQVKRFSATGDLVATVSVPGGPKNLGVDYMDRVWSANSDGGTMSRIDPATDAVDLQVALPGHPWAIGDMTGHTIRDIPPASGRWIVDLDAGESRSWGRIDWTADVPEGSSITVKVAPVAYGDCGWAMTAVANGVPFSIADGRYLTVEVELNRSLVTGASPILYDLTISPL